MLEKLTAMQDRMSQRCVKSAQPCGIGCPKDVSKLTAMQGKYFRDVGKVHTMQDRKPHKCFNSSMLFQRWFESSQPCRIASAKDD